MADTFTPEVRSRTMRAVKNRNTRPEVIVRRLLHAMGYRFRLHRKDLPGSPDIVLPRYRKVIFVHGCFWHGHPGCNRSTRPTSNTDFWDAKIDRNIARDEKAMQELISLGWQVFTIWECDLRDIESIKRNLTLFLDSTGSNANYLSNSVVEAPTQR